MKSIVILIVLFGCSSAQNVSRYVRLNNGIDCPIVGLGTGGHKAGGPPQGKVVIEMVHNAVDDGYRHIDTSSNYLNEEAIGKALNEIFAAGKVKREDMFITTKITPNATQSRTEALNGVHLALKKLNTTYVDLMLIHRAAIDPNVNDEVWKGLEDALAQKLVKSIGISNFDVQQIDSLLKNAKIIPAMLQVESHPQQNQRQLIDYCRKYDIHLTAYSPLGAGTLIKNPTIVSIGKSHNKSAATVMIRWQVQRGVVAIPKSTKNAYIIENIDVFDWTLTDNEMKVLEDMK